MAAPLNEALKFGISYMNFRQLLMKNMEQIMESNHIELSIDELINADLDRDSINILISHFNQESNRNSFSPNITFDGETLKAELNNESKMDLLDSIRAMEREKKIKAMEREKTKRNIVVNLYRNHDIKDAEVLASMTLSDVEDVKGVIKMLAQDEHGRLNESTIASKRLISSDTEKNTNSFGRSISNDKPKKQFLYTIEERKLND
ncbi:hypothetical protein bcgnr5390_11380 [Bacillus luti]|nr:hypothetical protein BC2903_29530 [Bacillus cereus]